MWDLGCGMWSGDGREFPVEEVVGAAAGGFFVAGVLGQLVESENRGVMGFGEEGLGAHARNACDGCECFLDVGLLGPVGEVEDVGVELFGDVGEAGVVVEPGGDALDVGWGGGRRCGGIWGEGGGREQGTGNRKQQDWVLSPGS